MVYISRKTTNQPKKQTNEQTKIAYLNKLKKQELKKKKIRLVLKQEIGTLSCFEMVIKYQK